MKEKFHKVNIQLLDNKASPAYKNVIRYTYHTKYKLVLTDVHLFNADKIAIHTFTAHLIAILSGIASYLPKYTWEKILYEQAEPTLNLLCQSNLNPSISAWEYLNNPFDFDAAPLGPMVCPVIIHNKYTKRKPWDQRGRDGYHVGPALKNYRCFTLINKKTKSIVVSETVELLHSYLLQPHLTTEDIIFHALNIITCAINQAPPARCNA